MPNQLYRPVPVPRKAIEALCDERTAVSPLSKSTRLPPDEKKRLIAEYRRAKDSYYKSLLEAEPPPVVDMGMVILWVRQIKRAGG